MTIASEKWKRTNWHEVAKRTLSHFMKKDDGQDTEEQAKIRAATGEYLEMENCKKATTREVENLISALKNRIMAGTDLI